MSPPLQDVAIIGGGLSGPALALCLKKQGITSTIYELRSASYNLGGYISLSANALRVLDHIDIYEKIRTQGYTSEQMHLMNHHGTVLGVMTQGNKDVYGYSTLRVRRAAIRDEMFRNAADHGIAIKYEKKLLEVNEQDGMVILHFDDGTSARHHVAVGADGIHSSMREYIDTTSKPYYCGIYVTYGMMPEDQLHLKLKNGRKLPKIYTMVGPEGSFMIWPTDPEGKKVAFIASFALPDLGREGWDKLANDKEELRRLLISTYCGKGWPEEIEVLCREAPDEELMPGAAHVLPTLSSWKSPSGRVIIIGDAAHAIPPTAAQGGAMSFEDSETLAHALSVANESSLISILQKWEDHRKERLQRVLDLTNLYIRIRSPSPNWLLQAVKEWFIWGTLKYRGPGAQRWLYEYDTAQIASKL